MDLSLINNRIMTKMSGKSKPDILLYDEVSSTNDILKDLALQGNELKEGSVVVAMSQTGGKGRSGRKFFSPKDSSLYFSILLRPDFPLEKSFLITPLAAVAVYETLRDILNIECKIKWVNDLFYNDKKVCGILAESKAMLKEGVAYPEYVVLGIGINVFMPSCKIPDDIKNIFGTLFLGEDKLPNQYAQALPEILFADMIFTLREKIMKYYERIDQKDFMSTYREASMVVGRKVSYLSGNEKRNILVTGIGDDGSLIAMEEDGTINSFRDGEIRIML